MALVDGLGERGFELADEVIEFFFFEFGIDLDSDKSDAFRLKRVVEFGEGRLLTFGDWAIGCCEDENGCRVILGSNYGVIGGGDFAREDRIVEK